MSGRRTVVYVDGALGGDEIEREVLTRRGYDLVLAGCTTDDEVVETVGDAPAILNVRHRFGLELFERLPALEVVVKGGVGYDNIDVEAATRCGVVVCNVVDYATNEVANHAFAMLLALNRALIPVDRAAREGTWGLAYRMMPHTGRMSGETLGLVSFGTIARAVARRAAGFEMDVVAYDPYVDEADAKALGVEMVTLQELLRRSDYVSVHTPLTAATRGLVGADELALLKPSAYIVLTSRGGVIDERALAEALREGRIAGAGIDVWEHEPAPADHPLLQLDNVVASTHFGWYSALSNVERRRRHAETAADFLDGTIPSSVVNPEVLERPALRARPR